MEVKISSSMYGSCLPSMEATLLCKAGGSAVIEVANDMAEQQCPLFLRIAPQEHGTPPVVPRRLQFRLYVVRVGCVHAFALRPRCLGKTRWTKVNPRIRSLLEAHRL